MKGFILLLLTVCTFNSCSVDNCDLICNSGPLSLNFQLLDKDTGENLFTNGTFSATEIIVLDLDNNNSPIQFTFNEEDDINVINLGPFGWGTNIVNYSLEVAERNIFILRLDAEQKSEDCCSYVQINKIEIENADYSQNIQTGIYEVLVDL
jgi:hypothetical protein